MTAPASGTQHILRAGDYEAVIASVGASLRTLAFTGRDLVVPFAADAVRPDFRGVTLAPWPNRIVDGIYDFDGATYRAPLTEPSRGHALHGLVAWLDFDAVDKSASHVTLAATIVPQPWYPWRVRVETTYALGPDGLTQSVTATNESDTDAPYGTGPHPYLRAGEGRVDDWTLTLPAAEVLEVTPERLAPVDLRPVADLDVDFRSPRLIGSAAIDHAFTTLSRQDEATTVVLTAKDGTGVTMTWGTECPWVQLFTGDAAQGAADPSHRSGLAVEPMTCAPDAFNAARYPYDTGLVRLAPDVPFRAEWTIAGA